MVIICYYGSVLVEFVSRVLMAWAVLGWLVLSVILLYVETVLGGMVWIIDLMVVVKVLGGWWGDDD